MAPVARCPSLLNTLTVVVVLACSGQGELSSRTCESYDDEDVVSLLQMRANLVPHAELAERADPERASGIGAKGDVNLQALKDGVSSGANVATAIAEVMKALKEGDDAASAKHPDKDEDKDEGKDEDGDKEKEGKEEGKHEGKHEGKDKEKEGKEEGKHKGEDEGKDEGKGKDKDKHEGKEKEKEEEEEAVVANNWPAPTEVAEAVAQDHQAHAEAKADAAEATEEAKEAADEIVDAVSEAKHTAEAEKDFMPGVTRDATVVHEATSKKHHSWTVPEVAEEAGAGASTVPEEDAADASTVPEATVGSSEVPEAAVKAASNAVADEVEDALAKEAAAKVREALKAAGKKAEKVHRAVKAEVDAINRLNPQKCTPTCSWQCDNPKCDEVCTPVCAPQKCETRCNQRNITFAEDCRFDCDMPSCSVQCPARKCPKLGCAHCQNVCSEPVCKFTCPASHECRNVCEEPKCHFECAAPEDCPMPQCRMVCEKPKDCGCDDDGEEAAALPAVALGEVRVKDFFANSSEVEVSLMEIGGKIRRTKIAPSEMFRRGALF